MKKRKFKPKRNFCGVVLAELVLTLPILLAILFVIIELGNIFFISNSINQVARNAARYAATHESYTLIELKDYATRHGFTEYVVPDIDSVNLTISPAPGSQNVGDVVTVIVTYSYVPFVNPFNFVGGGVWSPTIVGTAKTRVEVGS